MTIAMFKYPLVVTFELMMRIIFALPRYRACNWAKSWFLRLGGARVGRRVVFYPGVWIMTGKGLVIGDDVDLALDVLITTGGGVTIGSRTLVGYRTQILSANHVIPPGKGNVFGAGHQTKPVDIGPDVWIGAGCLILPGVTIGEGAVIGAGSVVTKSVPPFSIAAGNPARVLRQRC